MGTRVVLVGVVAAVLAATGCGQAATHGGAGGKRDVYEITIAFPGSVSPLGGVAKGWLDPAQGRYRLGGREAPDHGMPAVTVTDVGAPGIDESTTSFAGMPAPQTTLTYGSGMSAIATYQPAMDALQSYLGLHPATHIRFTIDRAHGHVQLTIPLADVARAFVVQFGAAPMVQQALRHASRRTGMVVTILRAIPPSSVTTRRLFTVDPAKADEVVRTIPAGVAPTAPKPAYWLGSSYGGRPAQPATSTMATTHARMTAETDYSVTYGHPVGDGAQLTIDTIALPTDGLPGRLGRAFGGKPIPIHLADGRPAKLVYQRYTGRLGTASSSGQVLGASSGKLPPARDIPPIVLVFTGHEQIMISPGGPLSRTQAIALAESLRPL